MITLVDGNRGPRPGLCELLNIVEIVQNSLSSTQAVSQITLKLQGLYSLNDTPDCKGTLEILHRL